MIKGLFATFIFASVFLAGMNYAILHPKTSKEVMTTVGCNYTPGSNHK